MKQFLIYISALLIITLGLMMFGEMIYTYAYNNGAYRNKVMWARDLQENTPLDYVILGNSISHYGVNPAQIEASTGKIGINLSYNSSHPYDMFLMFKSVVERNPVKKIYIQLDHSYRTQVPDEIGAIPWLPYIREPEIANWYGFQGGSYHWYQHIPFYRYQKYGSQLGIRDVTLSMLGKQPEFLKNHGFNPMDQPYSRKGFEGFEIVNKQNPGIDAIIRLAKEKQVHVEFFTSPVFEFEGDYSVLKNRVPNYTNFANQLSDSIYFMDEIHLNKAGAAIFTDIFAANYFRTSGE